MFLLPRSVPPGDGPLPPPRRAGVRPLREAIRRLVERTRETSLGRQGLLRRGRDQHQSGPASAGPPSPARDGASSNGRAAVLQTADGGSIPRAPTKAEEDIPRSTVVSRPLKPVTLVRLQLGEPTRMVVVVYWRARLAVNEEVRVQSPPITLQLGVGQWLATWPGTRSTQVRFLPPRLESADEWSSTGPENRGGGAEPQRFDSSALVSCPRHGAVR